MPFKAGIILVEDHPLMRDGIKALIHDHGEFAIIAEASTIAQARALMETPGIELALLDISLPDGSGVDLIKEIKAKNPRTRIVILTMHNEGPYLANAISQNADGYVVKDMAPEKLIYTLKTVMGGEKCFFNSKSEALNDVDAASMKAQSLSTREELVKNMLIEGKSLTEIATELELSVKTVFTYRVRVLKKLGLKNNAELIKYHLRGSLRKA